LRRGVNADLCHIDLLDRCDRDADATSQLHALALALLLL
jgi:hypothetical protein